MKKEKITTDDGSNSLYSEEFNDCYHSKNGAVNEAKHIYIQNGLQNLPFKKKINILDVGFGTGLNALCTMNELKDSKVKVNYIGIEPFPIDMSILKQLNFAEFFDFSDFDEIYNYIHTKPKNNPHYLTENFILNIIEAKIQDVHFQDLVFDLVYFDPFKPASQPELWSELIFKKVYNSMAMGGILVTYSSCNNTQIALKSAGFKVEKVVGPKGKKEIIKATKQIEVAECQGKCNSCSHNH